MARAVVSFSAIIYSTVRTSVDSKSIPGKGLAYAQGKTPAAQKAAPAKKSGKVRVRKKK